MPDESRAVSSAWRLATRWRNSPKLQGAAWLAGVMALALGVALVVMRVWRGSLSVPYYLSGDDSQPFVAAVKGLLSHGWYFGNPSLGAPSGQDLIDFAGGTAENLQWAVIRVLGFITGDAAVTTNLYLLLAFPAVAGATWLVLRRLGASRLAALVAALLFTFLPFHFAQSAMGHQFLAAYVAVPLAGWLVIRAMRGEPLFTRRTARAGMRAWVSWRNAWMVAVLIVIGGSTLYYAVFALFLLVGAGLVAMVAQRSWRGALSAVWSIFGVGIVLALNLLPAVIYRSGAGPNPALASRRPFESEVFSLSITQLLAPVQGHRVSALARAYDKSVESTTIVGERGNQLGTVLAIALVCGLVALCAWAIAARPPAAGRRLAAPASVGALLAILLGTFGGISSLVAIYLTPHLRVWSRLTPFVAFFCAVLLVVGLDWAARRLRDRTGAAWPGVLVMIGIGIVGILDQAPPRVIPNYAADAAGWQADASFVSQLEREVPPGSAVLQLPYVPFPESKPVRGVGPYDHLIGYLHADDLRWSYGAIRGRDADWQASLAGLPPSAVVDAAVAAGFAGVYLDTAGYEDGGAAVRAAVDRAAGRRVTPVVSPDGRRQFLPLAGARDHLLSQLGAERMQALAASAVTPVGWSLGPGFLGEETDGTSRWNWAVSPATLRLRNPADHPQRVALTGEIESQPGSRVQWSYVKGQGGSFAMGTTARPIRWVLVVPPGTSDLVLTTNGANVAPPPDGRDLRINLRNPAVMVLPPVR